ncbi:C40 family peptidase [uncultured Azonexus sp.]|uniref:C40 family peptidase n=1 Tax=uncultured Azonexus sp. TaxID=520307 RepID=UPI001BC4C4D2|nr:C40 family peptidase [uncultured Azonexus sp.]MBS4017729.1 C40 family peptidase [Dechloromonas sp.]
MKSGFAPLLLAACLALNVQTAVHASETTRQQEAPMSLFERYTNATQDVILEGLKLVGVRYKMGGNSIEAGLDCSSFVQTVFKESIGAYLPRTAREQSQVGEQVDLSQLKPGDLVFFNTMRRAFSHVGIYLGDNHFLHAPRAGAEVRVENMNNSYWMTRFNGARRIIEAQ